MILQALARMCYPFTRFVSRNLLRPLAKRLVYTVRHGFAKGLKTQGGLDFIPRPLAREELLFTSLDLDGKVVYDIGAFDGLYTIGFARTVGPSGQVVAFEPNPQNRRQIETKLALNEFENVALVPMALGASTRAGTLIVPQRERAMGTLHEDRKAQFTRRGYTENIDVAVDTLDHQLDIRQLPRPDFIKIDVEGLELEVLRGMQATLRKHRPMLFIEVHGKTLDTRNKNEQELVAFLSANGYSRTQIESNRRYRYIRTLRR